MKLEITKERVLKAAEKCPDAKNILTELFSEVFEQEFKKGNYYQGKFGVIVFCTKDSNGPRFDGACVKGNSAHDMGDHLNSWMGSNFTEIESPLK